jgi:hypothetical protein
VLLNLLPERATEPSSDGEVPRKVTAFRDFLIDWLKKFPLS